MKTFLTLFSPLLLAIAPLAGANPIDKRVICPLYIPAPSPDPFEVAVLVKGQPLEAFTYSSGGPLGLWGPAQTALTCPGYFYLNANQKTALYATLTFDAAATTKWNATAGSDLIKLVAPTPSVFLACKRPATSAKAGDYVLFLVTEGNVPVTLESDDGDSIVGTSCVKTKIHSVLAGSERPTTRGYFGV
ncbi:hypothetical protein M407DRAFT_5483 [Tulasnella calospora MUT 4182]|uniref:Ubiquitin 3 binding protein But2 C-terminal domain-containing protein n=1 Tax=Tulasnella calospora MUT 4182 TaxID=1051891 RepID=A0A0C3L9Z0_9AGAM|nr:hypothetical protein M407DRAFT_5483 [Tulasnella calospora MUT 4182]